MKLSDYVVGFLEEQGVTDAFMVTGGGCMHLVNSFGNSEKIRYFCTHHEQSAAMAAEAYAKFKNDLGVVLVTSGPGATNAITGLAGAYQDSVPCIFLSGQSKRKQTVYNSKVPTLRQFGVQEVNIIPVVEPLSKYAVMVNEPEKIRYYLEKAVAIAKGGRPGPVWIDIPLDVQSAVINEKDLKGYGGGDVEEAVKDAPTQDEVAWVVERLRQAERPVMIAGHGIRLSGALDGFRTFVEQADMPVVTPIMGIDLLCEAHQNNIGRVGTKGTRAGNFAMQNADLILAVGSRLAVSVVGHEYELFAREADVVVVDIDPYEHQKKTIEIDKLILSDAKAFFDALLQEKTGKKQYAGWLRTCNAWKAKYPVCLPEYDDDSDGINYYKFVDLLSNAAKADMPIISDAGSAFYAVSQGIKLKDGQRYITSGAIATMGFGVPAAIGVSVADPGHTVLSVTGDGSFQQNLQELEVMRLHNMPVKVFVMNNNGYFSIRQTQNKFFGGNHVGESAESGISFPDTRKIAEAYGIPYHQIKTVREMNENLEKILGEPGPAVVEVVLTAEQEIVPTNASLLKPDGTMVSKPLEDMYPFLPREEFLEAMVVKPLDE